MLSSSKCSRGVQVEEVVAVQVAVQEQRVPVALVEEVVLSLSEPSMRLH